MIDKIERFAFCEVCGAEYDRIVMDIDERCAFPRKSFGRINPYCNGKLKEKKRVWKLKE